jgi:hypothetical protein
MIELVSRYETMIWWMMGLSIITFISTLVAVPLMIVRIPSDYFSHDRRNRKLWANRHPIIRTFLLTVKNLLGYFLIAIGAVMLVIPGQGMLTILIGVIFLDLPGKYKVERWVVMRPAILRSINWLRNRSGKAPLLL